MASRHSSLAPKTVRRRSLSVLIRATGSHLTLKPKRDALTRVRHDLRSLVHSVVGYSDLLAEPRYGVLSAEQTRFVSHLRGAAEHLQELVDTCIELSRPAQGLEGRTLELPATPVVLLLRRIRSALSERRIACDLRVPSELESASLTVDVAALERALVGLALVITRDGAVSCELAARGEAGKLVLCLRASDAAEASSALVTLDHLEDQIGNRDFVRLKLSEVLLVRQGLGLNVSPALDTVEFELGAA